jgi:hypothetical protein
MKTRLRHWGPALRLLPGWLASRRRRALFREVRAFERRLPLVLERRLPEALRHITPSAAPLSGVDASTLRRMSDLAAVLDRGSPLGLCLRRSLTRYHFLRRAGHPVALRFGATLVRDRAGRAVAGHAWVVLDGEPYHEVDDSFRGQAVMLRWPEDA